MNTAVDHQVREAGTLQLLESAGPCTIVKRILILAIDAYLQSFVFCKNDHLEVLHRQVVCL